MTANHTTDTLVVGWSLFVASLEWLTATGLPAFIVWGTAMLIAWRLWVVFQDWRRKPDRSQDGTHY
jgi:hypothetical protein